MFYDLTDTPLETKADVLIATATNGAAYTENNRLHVKSNDAHYIYKYDGNPVGWYRRNVKTLDDFYLGAGACPSVVWEGLSIKDEEGWQSILLPAVETTSELAKKIEEMKNVRSGGTAK